MRYSIVAFVSFLLLSINLPAQQPLNQSGVAASGYNIPVTLEPFKNTWVYLGSHFGKFKNLADSAWLDENSQGVFKGKEKLPKGIYFLVSPARYLLFEFLMDGDQNFSIKADTTDLAKAQVTGSEENKIFFDYSHFLAENTPRIAALQEKLQTASTKADSSSIQKAIEKEGQILQAYREELIKTKPNSMLAKYFFTMKRPEIPELPKLANGKIDSGYAYRYVKDNWWEGVDLSEEGLVRTPFFEPKLEEYFKYYVAPDPDSIISETNYMLLMARENREMFQYLLGKFTDKYINPEYMGQEKVFLFLFDKYFSKGDTSWLSQQQRKFIFDRAYSLMANQLGEPGADFNMVDTLGRQVSLYGIKSPYTFITFWDPNCGHCKEMVPRIDSIYQAKWKAQGVKMLGVNIDADANKDWKKFINEHKIKGWTHIYQTKEAKEEEAKKGVANYRQLYDVYKTPTMYLLDEQKRIIGKMLTIEQFDEVLQAKIKGATSK